MFGIMGGGGGEYQDPMGGGMPEMPEQSVQMQAPQQMGMPTTVPMQGQQYGGLGQDVAPLPNMTGEERILYGRYLAEHGDQAAVRIQELDKAAKFRRALSMIQETFATITGREDIAARVRQQIVDEDYQRAAAVEQQILARVGQQSIAEERLRAQAQAQAEAKKDAAAKLSETAKLGKANNDDFAKYAPLMPKAPPDQLMAAINAQNEHNDKGPFSALWLQYYDPAAETRAKELAQVTGEVADAKVKQAGRESGARARASKNVELDPKVVDAEAEAAGKKAAATAKAVSEIPTRPRGGGRGQPKVPGTAQATKFVSMIEDAKGAEAQAAILKEAKSVPFDDAGKQLLIAKRRQLISEAQARLDRMRVDERNPDEAQRPSPEQIAKAERDLAALMSQ